MTFTEYMSHALRTWGFKDAITTTEKRDSCLNAALGLAGEAGETVDLIKKVIYHGHPFDADKLKKEIGDVLYYAMILAWSYDLNPDEIVELNVEKLKTRYGNQFCADKSLNRKD